LKFQNFYFSTVETIIYSLKTHFNIFFDFLSNFIIDYITLNFLNLDKSKFIEKYFEVKNIIENIDSNIIENNNSNNIDENINNDDTLNLLTTLDGFLIVKIQK
jgi:hypothetical protein